VGNQYRSIINKQGTLLPGPNNIIKIACSFFLSFLSGRLFISFLFQESACKSAGTKHALLYHFSVVAVMRTGQQQGFSGVAVNGNPLHHMAKH